MCGEEVERGLIRGRFFAQQVSLFASSIGWNIVKELSVSFITRQKESINQLKITEQNTIKNTPEPKLFLTSSQVLQFPQPGDLEER